MVFGLVAQGHLALRKNKKQVGMPDSSPLKTIDPSCLGHPMEHFVKKRNRPSEPGAATFVSPAKAGRFKTRKARSSSHF
jgi:hypothetical protein